MREWLTVIIVLLIVAVLLDGWRRMRRSRQENIKMSLSMHKGIDKADLEAYGSELPNGGARVVGRRDTSDARQLSESLQKSFENSKNVFRRTVRSQQTPESEPEYDTEPEQVPLNLDEQVPMLMEPVGDRLVEEPSLGDPEELDELLSTPRATPRAESASQPARHSPRAPAVVEPDEPDELADEVLIINVMAPAGTRLPGSELLEVVLDCGLRYGDRKIFHRHLYEGGEGPQLFSMVNMVVPGTFELSEMDNFETPGISLFMMLPMEANSIEAFNLMARTATRIADRLGAELKDEQRSVMTQQTLEHCRQRIRDFERKLLSRGQ